MTRVIRAVLLLAGVALVLMPMAGVAAADDCVALGGALVPAAPPNECVIAGSTADKSGTFNLDETLHILNGGLLNVVGNSAIKINITGSFLMDAGSKIDANYAGAGYGGDIEINATDDIRLKASPTGSPLGAIITSNQILGSCPSSTNRGGNIALNADSDKDVVGNLTMEPGTTTANGSKITSVSPCGRGEIILTGVNVDVDGDVLSEGTTTQGRGGPITVNASCNLIITDLGSVVSKGKDPGADLVHLQGGCVVTVFGLVASTGPGHTPTAPANKCNSINRPGKPVNSRGCVEIWAGDLLVIDATAPHNGEVNADTGQNGGPEGIGWIDLFSKRGDIVIKGDTGGTCQNIGFPTYTPCYAVHANQFLGDLGHGGIITIQAFLGNVTMSGLAVQASDTANGAKGGVIIIEALLDVDLKGSTTEAKGAIAGGGGQKGGTVIVRSFTMAILTDGTSKIDVTGGNPPNGAANLKACLTIGFPPGTIVPAAIVPSKTTGLCGGAPVQPSWLANVILPCLCGGCPCVNTFRFVAGAPNKIRLDGDQLKALLEARLVLDNGSGAATSCEPTAGVPVPFVGAKTDAQRFVDVTGVAAGTYHVISVSGKGSCCSASSVTIP